MRQCEGDGWRRMAVVCAREMGRGVLGIRAAGVSVCKCRNGGLAADVIIREMEERQEIVRWYAVKVFFNRMNPLKEQLILDGVNFFVPDVVKSLLFVQVTDRYLAGFEKNNYGRVWIYRDLLTGRPSAIPDREMEIFIFVCTAGEQGLSYLGEDRPEYHQGDRVRVTEGVFKGAEGYIKRIKKDRRLVVSVRGVAAVATMHIPPEFLEVIAE